MTPALPLTTTRVVLPGLVEPSGLLLEQAPVEPPAAGEGAPRSGSRTAAATRPKKPAGKGGGKRR